MTVEIVRHRFTTDDYFRMVKAGILGKDDRVELIEGEIVEMPPIGSFHSGIVNRLVRLFTPVIGTELVFSPQNPVAAGPDSAPQPDVALLRWRDDEYTDSTPTPGDVLLLIEIAESTLASDQRIKAPLYASAAIQELWIVNLKNASVEVHTEPSEAGYRSIAILRGSDKLSPKAVPSISFTVAELLRQRG
jgi:Uma2 family endonuclease